MSTILKYIIHDANDQPAMDYEFPSLVEAETKALGLIENGAGPFAIIERQYELADTELVWTSTDDSSQWPPTPRITVTSAGSILNGEVVEQWRDSDTATCHNCGGDIEYSTDNEPPWTHTDTGFSDCPVEDGEEPSGFHAEPEEGQ